MRWSRRAVTGGLLLAWGTFLGWMAVSGAMTSFLGPRTYWVAWFGAAALLLAGAATLLLALRTPGPPARPADHAGVIILMIPIVLVLALPSPELGALAASRKASGVGPLDQFLPSSRSRGEVGLSEIHYASLSSEYADAVGVIDGAEVELVGFVTRPKKLEPGTFSLTRFYISCCAADAVPYSVTVTSDEDLDEDTWVRVTGTLRREAQGFTVEPDEIAEIEEPSSPYLY